MILNWSHIKSFHLRYMMVSQVKMFYSYEGRKVGHLALAELPIQTKCMFGAISSWNATLHSRVGRFFSCSTFLLYYEVSRSSQRWRQMCTQSILNENTFLDLPSSMLSQKILTFNNTDTLNALSQQRIYLAEVGTHTNDVFKNRLILPVCEHELFIR